MKQLNQHFCHHIVLLFCPLSYTPCQEGEGNQILDKLQNTIRGAVPQCLYRPLEIEVWLINFKSAVSFAAKAPKQPTGGFLENAHKIPIDAQQTTTAKRLGLGFEPGYSDYASDILGQLNCLSQ